MDLAKRIKKIREKRNMTMQKAAQKIGVSVSTYRDWEYGRKIPATKISKIAKALSVSINELLGEPRKNNIDNVENAVSLIEEALKKLRIVLG